MDVLNYTSWANPSEKETALFFQNLGLECVALNWKKKNANDSDDGEIDGVFFDSANQLYIIYDDSTQKQNRQDKISKFLNKWKDAGNQNLLREGLQLKDYHIYVLYIDKSEKETKLESIEYAIDDYTKIIYTEDYVYFETIFKVIGRWVKNDFYNFLGIRPRKKIKQEVNANQIWIGNTPAYVFSDRVENILNYSFISRKGKNTNGYQRLVEKKRVDQMAALIRNKKITSFPNSILLNCIEDLDVIPKPPQECPAPVKLNLPNCFSSCKVVDGQHRLLAFSRLDPTIQDSHSLAIVMFLKMPIEEEIRTFIDINKSQKRIDPNLIYSLKSDLAFQTGTKENREKLAVEIAKKLNHDATFFKSNIFFGNAGEDKKNKITLTSIVQALLENKIIDFNKGFLQTDENDIESPYLRIKEAAIAISLADSSNLIFYKSNNGIQLILRFCSLFHRNIEKGNIKLDFDTAINNFTNIIKKNKPSLSKKYGKAGFSALSKSIFTDLKSTYAGFSKFETEQKKLK